MLLRKFFSPDKSILVNIRTITDIDIMVATFKLYWNGTYNANAYPMAAAMIAIFTDAFFHNPSMTILDRIIPIINSKSLPGG
ncbi:hypothetical protein Pcaca04_04820 [Pectobacterium carotovorum subsp. carotovorum]|nr:hypothetical protein Pcaca04_04820 [Pectobacterium carotovorum subsp. carotovorum]